MSTPKLPRPPGHNTLTPTTISLGAKKVIAFLEKVFGGKVRDIYEMPDGNIAHSEVMIDGSVVMIADPMPGWPAMPAAITVYVEDGPAVDAAYARAIDAGATSVKAPRDEFYGHRSASVTDSAGNRWSISSVIEVLTSEQIAERMSKMGH